METKSGGSMVTLNIASSSPSSLMTVGALIDPGSCASAYQ
jgi:hypothetical protein